MKKVNVDSDSRRFNPAYVGNPFTGKTFYSRYSVINVRQEASVSSAIVKKINLDNTVGMAAYSKTVKDSSSGKEHAWFLVKGVVEGWVRDDVVYIKDYTASEVPTTEDGKVIAEQLVKNDSDIYHRLLRCAESLERMKRQGKNVSAYQGRFDYLNNRYKSRQKLIKENKGKVNYSTGYKEEYDPLAKKFSGQIAGIGAIPLIPIAIAFIVGIAAAATLYAIFKPSYSESAIDLKVSKDLESALASVSPEIRQSIINDLEGQVDRAYNRGKTDGKFGGMGEGLKLLGFGALGFIAFNALNKK